MPEPIMTRDEHVELSKPRPRTIFRRRAAAKSLRESNHLPTELCNVKQCALKNELKT